MALGDAPCESEFLLEMDGWPSDSKSGKPSFAASMRLAVAKAPPPPPSMIAEATTFLSKSSSVAASLSSSSLLIPNKQISPSLAPAPWGPPALDTTEPDHPRPLDDWRSPSDGCLEGASGLTDREVPVPCEPSRERPLLRPHSGKLLIQKLLKSSAP